MKYSEIKELATFCYDMGIDSREVFYAVQDDENDFEVNGYRFIKSSEIDEIQKDELLNDLYILGCFYAWFLASCSGIDQDTIETLQKAEAYEGLGKLMVPYIDEIQSEYARLDGYGHHFAHHDHNEHEILDYLVFRVN